MGSRIHRMTAAKCYAMMNERSPTFIHREKKNTHLGIVLCVLCVKHNYLQVEPAIQVHSRNSVQCSNDVLDGSDVLLFECEGSSVAGTHVAGEVEGPATALDWVLLLCVCDCTSCGIVLRLVIVIVARQDTTATG
jgi:hypothetical protein